MSKILLRNKKICGNDPCPTHVEIVKYDCGCVIVMMYNTLMPCSHCGPLILKQKHCGLDLFPNRFY
jgi:hypothetical protein